MGRPRRFAENVYVVTRRGVNAFILLEKRQVTSLTPDCPDPRSRSGTAVQELGRRVDEIKYVVLTRSPRRPRGQRRGADTHGAGRRLRARRGRRARPGRRMPGRCGRTAQGGRLIRPLLRTAPRRIDPVVIEHELSDGDEPSWRTGCASCTHRAIRRDTSRSSRPHAASSSQETRRPILGAWPRAAQRGRAPRPDEPAAAAGRGRGLRRGVLRPRSRGIDCTVSRCLDCARGYVPELRRGEPRARAFLFGLRRGARRGRRGRARALQRDGHAALLRRRRLDGARVTGRPKCSHT